MVSRVAANSHEDLAQLLATHATTLQQLGGRSVRLFGSFARGEGRADSEVDLLVEFEDTPTFDRCMDLKFFLEALLSRRFDLVTHAALRPAMRAGIEREAIRVA